MSDRHRAAAVAANVRSQFSTLTREGQKPVQVTVNVDTITLPSWVVESLLADRAKLTAWQETHYDEMDDED